MKDRFARWMAVWIMVLVSILVGQHVWRAIDEKQPASTTRDLDGDERHTIALFEAASPSVVSIFAQTHTRSGDDGNTGSGIVWDAAGNVVTNYHVVAGASRIRVKLDSGEAIAATLVGVAPDHDLAVIKLDQALGPLAPMTLGRSADLKVGQSVFVIGNPFGLSRTLTRGIISALGRRLPTSANREIAGVIQTDAAINPGNSGGPLLDGSGRLIGITTAIVSETGAFAGVGFAVPVDAVSRIVPLLIRDGRVPHPGIGIEAAPDELAARLGVTGLMISAVLPHSPAAAAGLAPYDRDTGTLGDVITHVDGHRVVTSADLALVLEQAGIGNHVLVSVLRDGRSRSVELSVMDTQHAS